MRVLTGYSSCEYWVGNNSSYLMDCLTREQIKFIIGLRSLYNDVPNRELI